MYTTDDQIEEIVNLLGFGMTVQDKYFFQESLYALVRLARKEYQTEMKHAVILSIGFKVKAADRTITKAAARQANMTAQVEQLKLRF